MRRLVAKKVFCTKRGMSRSARAERERERGGRSHLEVDNGLSLGGETDEALALLGEGDDRGSCSTSLRVLEHARDLAFHEGDARVGRAEIHSDDGTRDLARVESLLLRDGLQRRTTERSAGGRGGDDDEWRRREEKRREIKDVLPGYSQRGGCERPGDQRIVQRRASC